MSTTTVLDPPTRHRRRPGFLPSGARTGRLGAARPVRHQGARATVGRGRQRDDDARSGSSLYHEGARRGGVLRRRRHVQEPARRPGRVRTGARLQRPGRVARLRRGLLRRAPDRRGSPSRTRRCLRCRCRLPALCRSVPAFERALQRELSRQLAQRMAIASLMAAVSRPRRARAIPRAVKVGSDGRVRPVGAPPAAADEPARHRQPHRCRPRETVSRSFSALVQWGCLAVCNREVEILDPERLRACEQHARAGRTRGRAGRAGTASSRRVSRRAA